jgi:hypothetical protein
MSVASVRSRKRRGARFGCRIRQEKMSGGCAASREDLGEEGLPEVTGGSEFGRRSLQMPWRPASNSSSLGAQSWEREGEEWRGRGGGLIGMVGEPFLLRFNDGERGVVGGVGYQ